MQQRQQVGQHHRGGDARRRSKRPRPRRIDHHLRGDDDDHHEAATTTTTEAATTTTVPAKPVYPLTGVENPDPVIAARPALIVKIDNASGARPQSGFNEADLVFEEIVNDHITRFAMVFQSGDSDPVGPIRSGRLQDVDLFTALDHPLFAWSGGNKTVTNEINNSELVNIGPSRAAVYYRAKDRKIPHNLYSNTAALYTQTPPFAPPAKQQFTYREPGAPAAGTPSAGVTVKLDSHRCRLGLERGGRRVLPDDGRQPAHGPQQRSGQHQQRRRAGDGVRSRASPAAPTRRRSAVARRSSSPAATTSTARGLATTSTTRSALVADDGSAIQLQPGRTFIELPRQNSTCCLPLGPRQPQAQRSPNCQATGMVARSVDVRGGVVTLAISGWPVHKPIAGGPNSRQEGVKMAIESACRYSPVCLCSPACRAPHAGGRARVRQPSMVRRGLRRRLKSRRTRSATSSSRGSSTSVETGRNDRSASVRGVLQVRSRTPRSGSALRDSDGDRDGDGRCGASPQTEFPAGRRRRSRQSCCECWRALARRLRETTRELPGLPPISIFDARG